MVKVKICGITNLEDALSSIKAGCDALGFVFYRRSPRYITVKRAKEIIKNLPKGIIKIGVFANAKEKEIRKIANSCKLDILQFHGNESPKFCARFKGYKIIKAFRIRGRVDFKDILKYKTFAYLFDTFLKTKIGGTGKVFHWEFLTDIDKINRPIFLSGGLTAKNVSRAINTVHPDWVDVSSSVESSPGKKDHKKVREFIKAVKS
jgi:phosphoribosylanthranilate isomerase